MAENRKAFAAWIIKKWSEWDAKTGTRTTQQQLADHLGLTRSAIAQYVSGRQVPEGDSLRAIARKFGDEVYSILGIDPPTDEFAGFPPELAGRLRLAARAIENMLNAGLFAPGTPEHAAAAREVFARYGLELKDITTDSPETTSSSE